MNNESEINDLMKSIANEEKEKYNKKWEFFENVKDNLITDAKDIKKYLENFDDGDYWDNEGIVDSTKGFTKQEEESFIHDDKTFIVYIWQTTGYAGDDYSGEILVPLKDGKFWKISYAM